MISVLFAMKDSVYNKIAGLDVWDKERDASTFPGGNVIIAHPPCAQWGRMRGLAHDRPIEKSFGPLSINLVRRFGGIVEHPTASTLWKHCSVPMPGSKDKFGGFTICIDQFWFGHLAKKNTILYIVGCNERDLPVIPLRFDCIEYTIGTGKKKVTSKKCVSKRDRSATPLELANWLLEAAKIIEEKHAAIEA
jgi:hypothetical protein